MRSRETFPVALGVGLLTALTEAFAPRNKKVRRVGFITSTSYGLDIIESCRRVATYLAKILNGARALGIRIPGSILARANRVIE